MKELYRLKSASLPMKIAFTSFFGGTILLISQMLFPKIYQIMAFGLAFVLIALLLNFISLLFLLYTLFSQPKKQRQTIHELLTILCNIPIAAPYIFILINQNNF